MYFVTQWRNAFSEKCEMQTFGQVATNNDTEHYSLGESIWCLLLMITLWQKYVKSMIAYTLQYTTSPLLSKNSYTVTIT